MQDGGHVGGLQAAGDGGQGAGHHGGGRGAQVQQRGRQVAGHHQGDVHWLVLEAESQDG